MTSETRPRDDIIPKSDVTLKESSVKEDENIFQGKINYKIDGNNLIVQLNNKDYDVTDDVTQQESLNVNTNNNKIENFSKYLTFIENENPPTTGFEPETPIPRRFRIRDVSSKTTCSEVTSRSNKEANSRTPLLLCLPCRMTFDLMTSYVDHVTQRHDLEVGVELRGCENVSSIVQKNSDGDWRVSYLETLGDDVMSMEENDVGTDDVTKEDAESNKISLDSVSSLGQLKSVSKNDETDSALVKNAPENAEDFVEDSIDSEPEEAPLVLDLSKSPEKKNNFETSCSADNFDAPCDMSFAVASPNPVVNSPHTGHKGMIIGGIIRDDIELQRGGIRSPITSLHQGENELNNEIRSPKISSPAIADVSMTSYSDEIHHNNNNVASIANSVADIMMNNSSSVDPTFPMSLFQSRNSCKTLKCPKCNWHYKYRQTLEAHMKEKHQEDTIDCVYCKSGQPHPRLSRGESYSCGYKPFKCTVCNYSTTTKGNLSIHMQSDKHLYNARNLHHRQHERIRQEVASSTFHIPRQNLSIETPTTTNSNNVEQTSLVTNTSSPSPSNNKPSNFEKSNPSSNNRRRKPGTKPPTSESLSKSGGPRRESGSSERKWSCDVCGYETAIARNLRIHMTSEKHAQNMSLMERRMLNVSRQEKDRSRIEQQSKTPPQLGGLMDYYAAAFKSLHHQPDHVTNDAAMATQSDDVDTARKAQAEYLQQQLFLAQQQQMILAQQYQQIMMAAAASSLQQRMTSSKDDVNKQLALQQAQMWKQLIPQNRDENVELDRNDSNSTRMFSCGLCGVFGTDDVTALEAHVRKPRHTDTGNDVMNNEWVTRTQRDGYFCRLCKYNTSLKTNFNLHCKTEKHTCKLNLIAHVREGGSATEWMISHVITGNITQSVSCNACQFVTHSLEKIKLHCTTEQHQGVYTVCQYLHTLMTSKDKDDSEAKIKCMACSDYSTKHIIEMVKHMQTSEHQLELQRQKNPPMTTLQDVVTVEYMDENKQKDELKPKEPEKTKENNEVKVECEYCNYASDDQKRLQLHIMTQHNDEPLTQCPLCQEVMKDTQLQKHLVNEHQLSAPKTINNDLPLKIEDDEKIIKLKNRMLKEAEELEKAVKIRNDQLATTERNSKADDVIKNSDAIMQQESNEKMQEKRHNQPDDDVTKSAMAEIVSSEAFSRSCPDLLTSVEHSLVPENTRPKRIRLRSCPLNGGSRSRACRHLLSNYGLEQAIHYVENRSPQNKSKARHFKQERREREWNMSVDDQSQIGDVSCFDSNPSDVINKELEKKGEAMNENGTKSCKFCGKEFTGVWVLKAHEEVAHGVCVPAKKIQKIATAYSDQIMEKLKDQMDVNKEEESKENLLKLQDQDMIGKNQLLQEEIAQSQQKQVLIRALLNAQTNMQQEDSKTNQVDNLNQMYNADNMQMFNPMSLYSVLLQAQAAQAMGVNPYQQLLANAAVAQQMQQIGTGPMLHNLQDEHFPANPAPLSHNRGLEMLQKQENSLKQMQGSVQMPTIASQSNNFEIPVKRPRTRITDDQLKILRANFDINNSPTEEQIDQMANRTTLPPKVIKHWFRNTLFKERQRSKDSPYNFNIPPITSLEDAFKPKSPAHVIKDDVTSQLKSSHETYPKEESIIPRSEVKVKEEAISSDFTPPFLKSLQSNKEVPKNMHQALFNNALSLVPNLSPSQHQNTIKEPAQINQQQTNEKSDELSQIQANQTFLSNWNNLANMDNNNTSNDALFYSPDNQMYLDGGISGQGVCRRTPRTRFTDFQLQVLQEFFDRNAYPKDDDLDRLSQTLGLSTRVIVVWFQNARQKARKSYEQAQQPGGRYSPSLLAPTAGRENSPTVDDTIAKARSSLTQNPSPNVEDLARKALNEVSKSLAHKQEAVELPRLCIDENIIEDKKMEVKEKATKPEPPVLTCQMCESTFTNIDEFQKHQQAHLAANMASVQYGLMYMQGLMGSPSQLQDKQPEQQQPDDVTTFQPPSQNRKIAPNWSQNKASEESLQSFAAFQNGRLFSDDKTPSMVRSRLVTPPMLAGNLKRKISTSPTLSLSSSSSTSPASSGSRHKGMYIMDDKDHHQQQKDPKRLRTTITPDQLEYLYQQYLVDSSPSRKIIEQISEMVGLKKRVVQVWFQNTRARERKGQFRSSVSRVSGGQQMAQYRFCQPCRMVFKSKVDLDMHMQTTHMQNPESNEGNQPGNNNDEPAEKKPKPTLNTEDIVKKENMQLQNDFLALTYKPSVITSLNNSSDLNNTTQSRDEPRVSTTNKITYDVTNKNLNSDILPQLDLQKKFAAIYGGPSTNSGKPLNISLGETLGTNSSPKLNKPEKFAFAEQPPASYSNLYHPDDVTSTVESSMTQYQQQMTSYSSTSPSSTDSNSIGSKRYRTQMTSGQVKALKSCFKICKTPSLGECEILGTEVGLPKRVIQVWFQNARAKEKRGKLPGDIESAFLQYNEEQDVGTECDVCYPPVRYSSHHRAREHTFSRQHLQQLMKTMAYENQIVNENVWFSKSTGSVKSDVSTDDDASRNSFKAENTELTKDECEVCLVRFNSRQEAQEHSISRSHLQQVVKNMEKREQENRISPPVFELSTSNNTSANQRTVSPSRGPSYQSQESRVNTSIFNNEVSSGYGATKTTSENKFESKITEANEQGSSSQMEEYAAMISRNPVLLQQAMQQIIANSSQQPQQQEMPYHNEDNKQQQVMQAFQKSIYQMLNLSHAGSTGSQ